MPEAFKDKFNAHTISYLADAISLKWPSFEINKFTSAALHNLSALELKQRSNQIVQALIQYMPDDFFEACNIIESALAPPSIGETIQFDATDKGLAGWILMPVTDYITELALQDKDARFNRALELLHACTKRFSAEFSIRPFLRDYTQETLDVLTQWTHDPNVHVRRLASEGSRPYLPWGLRLHQFVKEPELVLPLLEQLKDDESEYVRRSVANHLNDIAKDHPDLVANIANDWWDENNNQRTKLIKHACRTLLKNGHPDVLAIFGYLPPELSKVKLWLSPQQLAIGDNLNIHLQLTNLKTSSQNLLIDYAVHHQKANGKLQAKIFKWSSFSIAPKSTKTIEKKHSFKPVTTRKYYSGAHKIEVLINGKSFATHDFSLNALRHE